MAFENFILRKRSSSMTTRDNTSDTSFGVAGMGSYETFSKELGAVAITYHVNLCLECVVFLSQDADTFLGSLELIPQHFHFLLSPFSTRFTCVF